MRPIGGGDGGHGGWFWVFLLLSGLSAPHAVEADTAEELLSRYHAEAQAESAAFRGFSVEEGRILYFRKYPAPVIGEVGCVSCHLQDPRRSVVRHRTKIPCRACHVIDDAEHVDPVNAKKREIDAFAPVANPRRFSDHDVVEEWFRLNCNYVLKRSCTAIEKGNLLAWLLTLQRGELDNKPELAKEYEW
ncbi:MAG: DUF1924 domain-containing protein [Betaproteobacteria bacterium]